MEMNFCRRCGTKLTNQHGHIFSCENRHTIFANSSPSVGIFLVNDKDEVLLAVRGIEPHKGMLDAFGGFLDGEELAEDAVKRELKEELGLEEFEYSPPKILGSGLGRYPYKGETLPLVSIFSWARLQTDRVLTPSDDVAGIRILKIEDINLSELHDDDIRTGIKLLSHMLTS